MTRPVDVLVVGGGPAGLTTAARLRELGVGAVLVVDREPEAGGVPRVSHHTGFGIRDLRRVLTGPQYARRLVERARDAGVLIHTGAMATQWAGPTSMDVTSPDGRLRVDAGAVVLATGARERGRAARLVPGDRPAGVLTTGLLQHAVNAGGAGIVGRRAVVVGAELVSWSAVLTLRAAGCEVVAMVSAHPRPETYRAALLAGQAVTGVPIMRGARVARIVGRDRVEAVDVDHVDSGQRARIACDTVVFTGDWIGDDELARTAGGGTAAGAVVDTALRLGHDGVFAAGNLLHPVDTADVAALDGLRAAASAAAWLAGARPAPVAATIRAGDGLRAIAPGAWRPGDPPPPRGRLLGWPTVAAPMTRVDIDVDGVRARSRRLPWPTSPGRILRIPWASLHGLLGRGAELTIHVRA